MNEFKVTSLDDIKKIAEGEIVPLQGFYRKEPFVVRLKRPSLLSLAAGKQIPNQLLNTAYTLFYGSNQPGKNDNNIANNAEIYKIVAKSALVEPSYDELEKAGVSLTDTQLIEIWQFSQFGVTALNNFRKLYASNEDTENKQKV
ncbi:hypothetical protein [Clostridium sp. HBUAS56017]|uniref:hypothetical protein n=1 Tax=Clostridium sp. HBUAS56017 TaxID=2571128 RepID=UPI0011776AB6|nr:hypothetical protein [Clostridium sp. HBUAS56017]